MNRAPFPVVRPFESVGTVRIISGASSLSNCTMTGPGSRRRGESESESVPWSATRSQSREPDAPSILQTHMLPEFESIVVRTIADVELSRAAHEGSEGCVPRSSDISQLGSEGTLVVKAKESTVGSPEFSSTAAMTNSGIPSSSKSARRGWVTER